MNAFVVVGAPPRPSHARGVHRTVIGSPSDWAILAVVVIVLFTGAKKFPELARALGSARREFDKGRKEETADA